MSRKLTRQNQPRAVLKFYAVIKIRGVNPYVLVSARRAGKIRSNWRRPLPVLVRVNGHPKTPWRINMMPVGDGTFYLYLHGEVRNASNTKVGDRVNVEASFDVKYRNGPMHSMPPWFRVALRENPAASKAWKELPPSRQKEVLRYFANLKSPEAQQRNLARAMSALSSPSERFMGRTWKNGK
jgi:hypothetical protein